MKSVVLTGIRRMELRDVPRLEIQNETDVLLKVEKVGVCGSDVHYYEMGGIGSQRVQFPWRLGHECSGIVTAIGPRVRRVKLGGKVAVDPAIVCHHCDQCKAGRENTCRNLKFLGCPGQAQGCLCEYIVMPQDRLYSIDDRLGLDQAALCEPLSISVYAIKQARISSGAAIAVLGAGPIGLSVSLAAKSQGIKSIYVTEKIAERLEVAGKVGPCWVGNPEKQDVVKDILEKVPVGVDAVFECAGEQETIDQAVELLKPGGKLMLIGIPRIDRVSFVIDKIRRKEITVMNVRRQQNCFQHAIDLVASGKVNVDFMITHRFRLEQTKEAFDLVAGYHDGVVKALIEL